MPALTGAPGHCGSVGPGPDPGPKLFLSGPNTPRPRRASWVASQIHGNMGIMGLAVVYYTLGEQWLASAGLVMAVLMLVHTSCVVLILSFMGGGPGQALCTP